MMGNVRSDPNSSRTPAVPRIVNFRVSPPTIRPGGEVRFFWKVENAARIRLYEDGRETDLRSPDSDLQVMDGWFSTTLKDTTTYRLVAENLAGKTMQKTFVVHVARPACAKKTVRISAEHVYPLGKGSRDAEFQDHGRLPSFGDSEMGGNNPKITVRAEVSERGEGNRSRLVLEGWVQMVEGKPDWSSFYKSFSRPVINLPEGCTLRKPQDGSIDTNGGRNNHKWTWYNGKGIIKKAKCRSDARGNDAGKLGCDIEFQPLRLSDL